MGRCGLLGMLSGLQNEKHSKVDGGDTHNMSMLNATESHFNPFKRAEMPLRYVHVCVLSRFSRVQLFATPWTVARQAPFSVRFSRQRYWRG